MHDRHTGRKRECPQAFRHGPTDGHGRCPWCGRKIEDTQPQPRRQPFEPTELTNAYGYYYDPDYGALTKQQVRTRYEMGQE